MDDAGRVRLRVTNPDGFWPDGVRASTSTLSKPPPDVSQARAESVEPPLSRCLEPTGASADIRLAQAIVRTLGGADDLRSTRAPGLIASLAQASDDADRLAMLAWISTAGPSRSAWLRRARESNDAAARAFAERRLVERHLDAKLSDWAMATLRGTRLDEARDPEAALLCARVYSALGNEALRFEPFVDCERSAAPTFQARCSEKWPRRPKEWMPRSVRWRAKSSLSAADTTMN